MPFLQYTAKTEDTMWSDLEDRESSQSISVQTCTLRRAVTKVLIGWGGGGGVKVHMFTFCRNQLKSIVFRIDFKRN